MKKVITALFTAMLVVVLAFALSGCSKANKIKKAYEDAGYTVSTATVKENEKAKSALVLLGLTDDQIKEAENWEVIIASKLSLADSGTAIVLKFPSAGELKDFLTAEKEDGSKDTAMYDKAKADEKINGDCLLLVGLLDAKNIFKNA